MILLARIRTRAAGLKEAEMWREIHYGREGGDPRIVKCSCGGRVSDRPASERGYEGGGCSHIIVLYSGEGVTKDEREAVGEKRYSGTAGLLVADPPWLVQLTALGKKMFEWRWAKGILERSS